jgi:hypothetical protein
MLLNDKKEQDRLDLQQHVLNISSVINKSVNQLSAMANNWLIDLPNFAYTL